MAQLATQRVEAVRPALRNAPCPDPSLGSRLAWMQGSFLLLELRLPMPPARTVPSPSGPAELFLDGARVPPPVALLALPDTTLVLAAASDCAEGSALELRREGRVLAETVLGPPGGVEALLRDRPAEDAAALLRRMLAAAPAFRARTDPRIAALCLALAAPLAARQAPARPLAGGAPGDRVSLWRLPPCVGDGPWQVLAPGLALPGVAAAEGGMILLDGLPGPGAVLVPPAGAPIPLAAPEAALPGLLAATRRGGALRDALLSRIAARARSGAPGAAALLSDLQLLAPARCGVLADPALPVGGALELALPDPEGGVFLRGWLRDPLGLVAEMVLRAPARRCPCRTPRCTACRGPTWRRRCAVRRRAMAARIRASSHTCPIPACRPALPSSRWSCGCARASAWC
jgi:hypothetical protein